MRKFLILLLVLAMGLSFIYGCGKKETQEDTDKVPPEVKEAEMADTTAMDSAMMEEPDSTMPVGTDSM